MKVVLILSIVTFAYGAKLPAGLVLCHKSDPKFIDCLRNAMSGGFQVLAPGYKPFGIPPLEPLSVEEMSNTGGGQLTQVFKNVKFYDVMIATVDKLQIDWDALTMRAEAFTPHIEMKADYSIKGNLLSFPIDSSGKCSVTLDEVKTLHEVQLKRFQKEGKNYLTFTDWKIRLTPGKVHFDFENIMPGNKQLSDTILQTMNENSIQVYEDQASEMEQAIGTVAKLVANRIFERIPENEIFLS